MTAPEAGGAELASVVARDRACRRSHTLGTAGQLYGVLSTACCLAPEVGCSRRASATASGGRCASLATCCSPRSR